MMPWGHASEQDLLSGGPFSSRDDEVRIDVLGRLEYLGCGVAARLHENDFDARGLEDLLCAPDRLDLQDGRPLEVVREVVEEDSAYLVVLYR